MDRKNLFEEEREIDNAGLQSWPYAGIVYALPLDKKQAAKGCYFLDSPLVRYRPRKKISHILINASKSTGKDKILFIFPACVFESVENLKCSTIERNLRFLSARGMAELGSKTPY